MILNLKFNRGDFNATWIFDKEPQFMSIILFTDLLKIAYNFCIFYKIINVVSGYVCMYVLDFIEPQLCLQHFC